MRRRAPCRPFPGRAPLEPFRIPAAAPAVPGSSSPSRGSKPGKQGRAAESDGSGETQVPGAQGGLRGEESEGGGGVGGGPGASQRRPHNCSQEGSGDPAAETEKEPGGGHP